MEMLMLKNYLYLCLCVSVCVGPKAPVSYWPHATVGGNKRKRVLSSVCVITRVIRLNTS